MRPVLLPMRSFSQTSEVVSGRNLAPQQAVELRTEGHDAIAVLEVGLSGATDEQVLRFAVQKRPRTSLDADFANVM